MLRSGLVDLWQITDACSLTKISWSNPTTKDTFENIVTIIWFKFKDCDMVLKLTCQEFTRICLPSTFRNCRLNSQNNQRNIHGLIFTCTNQKALPLNVN